MPKFAKSSLLSSAEVTHAVVQRAVEAALAAVLQEQKRRPVKPPSPPREVERRGAKAADGPTRLPRKRGFRGTPPPLENFSIANLSDDALLTEYEVAAVTRLSTNTLGTWRKRDDHPLRWVTIGGGRVRYLAGAVKQYLATGHRPQPGRPRKKDAAPAAASPKRKPRPSGTSIATTKISRDAAPELRHGPERLRAAEPAS